MGKLKKIHFKYLKPTFVLLLFLLSVKFVFATNYTDSDGTGSGFGGGTHTNTQWDAGNNWLEMDATGMTNGFATYTSRIINAGFSGTWSTLSWVPQRPLMKELPDSNAVETAYTSGNVDMTGNVLLLHMNSSTWSGVAQEVVDSSGSGNHGKALGTMTTGFDARFNRSAIFGGAASDYIDVPDSASLNITAAITLEGWFKVGTISTRTRYILDNGVNGSDGSNAYSAQMNTSGQLIFNTRGFSVTGLVTTLGYNDSFWHHFAMTYDSAGDRYRRIYVDGVLVKTGAQETVGKLISYTGDNTSVMRIGQYSYSTAVNYAWPGSMDELAIYNRALSGSEILDRYKRGALRARYQIRSCNDDACSGESFVGPGGVTNDYFEEQDLNTVSLPSRTISSIVSDNQYFQYRVAMETVSSTLAPEINSVTVAGSTIGSITVSSISGHTTEAGGIATYTVVLDKAPTANVTIDVSSSDTTEGTVSPSTLTFTSANWDTPQTVTVTGVNDFVDDGNIAYTIVNAAASSADASYNGVNPADVSVTNTDNENAGITVGSISGHTSEAGGTATYTVVLDSQPTADVTIGVSSSDTTEGTVSPATLTFTSGNWSTPQTVTVTGVNDSLVDGNIGYTIVNAAASSSDTNYNNMNPNDVSVTNDDNDTAGITVSTISGDTTEAGGTATFTVVLNTQPTDTVTIGISSSDTTEGTVSTDSLVFITGNWNTPQTVTVTGVSDLIIDGDIAYNIVNASAVSNDSNYNNVNPNDVSVTNIDSGIGDGGGGGRGGGAAVPEFSDFLSLLILGIGGIFIHSRVKKIQSMKS